MIFLKGPYYHYYYRFLLMIFHLNIMADSLKINYYNS